MNPRVIELSELWANMRTGRAEVSKIYVQGCYRETAQPRRYRQVEIALDLNEARELVRKLQGMIDAVDSEIEADAEALRRAIGRNRPEAAP